MIEWHGEKMLPRGLPAVIEQVTPHELQSRLRIVVLNRTGRSSLNGWQHPGWVAAHCADGQLIEIWPTVVMAGFPASPCPRWAGIWSFRAWQAFLGLLLHEIGHAATYAEYRDGPDRYEAEAAAQDQPEDVGVGGAQCHPHSDLLGPSCH